jgi:hypothetical protein
MNSFLAKGEEAKKEFINLNEEGFNMLIQYCNDVQEMCHEISSKLLKTVFL